MERRNFFRAAIFAAPHSTSRLFSQGFVAARAFVGDNNFREKLNIKLPENLRLTDTVSRPDAQKYRVVYAIATNKKSAQDLPFFSKVTLKHSIKSLITLGYQVAYKKIDIDPIIYTKKKFKTPKVKNK